MQIKALPALPKLDRKKNVCAYARVSSGKDSMLHSLSAQVSYYSALIQSNSKWLYCGVYSDEAMTGTKSDRPNFQRMLTDARSGKLDIIITKSISRFARNTVTLLETIRELKLLNVDVYFEEQNIHTLSESGELLLTLLASFAQEESKSTSDNQKWRIKSNFEKGIPWGAKLYGYKFVKDHLEIIPAEAETIRLMVKYYFEGNGIQAIANKLNSEGFRTRHNEPWAESSIRLILSNYYYTGNMMLQTGFRENHITKRRVTNNGEKPKYHIEESHEAIIPLEEFNALQEEMKRRFEHSNIKSGPTITPFSKMVVCAKCGNSYKRRTTKYKMVWACRTNLEKGTVYCNAKMVPEDVLYQLTTEVLGLKEFDEDEFKNKVKLIKAHDNHQVEFIMMDDSSVIKTWQPKKRSEVWTAEMKEKARQRELERIKNNGKNNSNSTDNK